MAQTESKSFPSRPDGLTSAAFILALVVYGIRSPLMLSCADTGWHLLTGELILSTGSVPISDPWSFTAGQYRWMNLSWLWDCSMALLEKLGNGLALPLAVNVLVNCLTLAIVIDNARRRGASAFAVIALLPLGLITFSFGAALRPQQITYLFLAVLWGICFGEGRPRAALSRLQLAAIFLLWGNLHGGFLLGLCVLCVWALESVLRAENRRTAFIQTGACLCCALAATLLNPLGISIFEAAFRTLTGPLRSIISEWQPLPWNREHSWYLFYLGLSCLALSYSIRARWLSWSEKAICVVMIIQTLLTQRHLPILFIVSFPAVALLVDRALRSFGTRFQWIDRRNRGYDEDFQSPRMQGILASSAFAASAALLFLAASRNLPAEIPPEYPVTEADLILRDWNSRRWLNFYFDGGYLLYRSGGEISLFIDGRAETAYPPQVVDDYLSFYLMKPGWEKIFERYPIDGVLLPKDSGWIPKVAALPGWKLAFEGPVRVAYVRAIR